MEVYNKNGLHCERFGFGEFVDYCINTPRLPNSDSSSEKHSENLWSGTEYWDEAVDYAKHGWDAGIKSMSENLETLNTVINVEHHVVGHTVDVGRYLMGVPDNMITFYDDTYRNKAPLTVLVKLDYLADIKGETAMEYSNLILETIVKLSQTFNVELIGCFETNSEGFKNVVFIDIKKLNDRFVLNNLAFAFHPAFFRRFWFKWLETKSFWTWGYGKLIENFGNNVVSKMIKDNNFFPNQYQHLPTIYQMEKGEFNSQEQYEIAVKNQKESLTKHF